MFDDTTDHQWQKNASYMVELRRWMAIFQNEGVPDCYLELWRQDIGLLMRPYIWILPSHEKKTLFRMDRLDGQQQVAKRLRTRWYLPGAVVQCREPVMAPFPDGDDGDDGDEGSRFQPIPDYLDSINHFDRLQRDSVDPYSLARRFLQVLGETDTVNPTTRWQLIEDTLDVFRSFDNPPLQWFHPSINDDDRQAGRWVPFWTCSDEFPADDMQELYRQIEQYCENFAPEGGFHPFVEGAEDEDDEDADDSNEGDEAYEGYDGHDNDDD